MSSPNASLIISTYNWPEALELCLKSVLKQKILPNEVIIADDGSGEETRQLINSFQHSFPIPLHHIWHPDEGFRKTIILNKAVEQSSYEYIIEIDGDVILHPYFIKDHLVCAEKNTFVRGTRAMLTEEKTEKILKSKNIQLHAFTSGVKNRNNGLRIFWLRFLGIRKEVSSRSVRGSNLSFWKDDFILVNGYNNELMGWGHEDEELAARFINNHIIKKIVKLCAVQYHLYHRSSNKDNEGLHNKVVEDTVKNKIRYCTNGYRICT